MANGVTCVEEQGQSALSISSGGDGSHVRLGTKTAGYLPFDVNTDVPQHRGELTLPLGLAVYLLDVPDCPRTYGRPDRGWGRPCATGETDRFWRPSV